ncbi:unnamed protein product [Brassica napus]|uniref:(rape) hypothetical protein n=1 Tax=Brassica napus TaxID=3708 RepID=A0A816Q3K1_BRANA|nr:unnamed protein product [Brassica napus]
MMKIRTPKTHKAKRVLEQRVPKLVENGKKTLILDERDAKWIIEVTGATAGYFCSTGAATSAYLQQWTYLFRETELSVEN